MFKFFKKKEIREEIREEIKYIADNFCKFKLIDSNSCYGIMNGNIYGEFCFGYKKIDIPEIGNFYQIRIDFNRGYLSLFIFNKKLKKDLVNAFEECEYYQKLRRDKNYREYSLDCSNHRFCNIMENIEETIDISECERRFLYKAFEPKILKVKQQLENKYTKRITKEEKERIETELQKKKNENELLKSIKFKGKKC